MRIAVTGASGFVGRALCKRLADQGHDVLPLVRTASGLHGELVIGDLASTGQAKIEADALIHLAARAHVMKDNPATAEQAYFSVNVDGTRRVIEMAVEGGARRLVYVSSIKAMAEQSTPGRPLRPSDVPAPEDAYGRSKLAAENLAREATTKSGMDLVIVRPPLVYGPGVKGNFQSLIRIAQSGLPLPIGSIDNRRSMVSLANLVDILGLAAAHPGSAGRVLLPSDGDDLSTPRLVKTIAEACGARARLVPFPPTLLGMFAKIAGKEDMLRRLADTLQVDDSEARDELGWHPVQSVEDGIGETVRSIINQRV